MNNARLGFQRAAVLLASAFASAAVAGGILVPDVSTRNGAMGEASTADPLDASAAYYNPAGMVTITGTEAEAGGYWWQPRVHHANGTSSERMDSGALVPHAYLATGSGLDRWRVGLAVNAPFGTSVDWGDRSDFRFLVTKARLTVLNIAPAASYCISDTLSVGANLNIYYGDADLNHNIELAPAPFPEGKFSFKGDGVAVGASAGIRWQPHTKHVLGIVYRSHVELPLRGSASLHSSLAPVTGSMATTLDLPQIVSVGYAFHPQQDWTIAADVEWVNWDVANKVTFHSSAPLFDGQTIPLDWTDSVIVRAGIEKRWRFGLSAGLGYSFWQNSTPDHTYTPLVPDSDYHSFSAGVGYSWKHFGLHWGYQYNLWETRNVRGSINGPVVDGRWEAYSHVIMFAAEARF